MTGTPEPDRTAREDETTDVPRLRGKRRISSSRRRRRARIEDTDTCRTSGTRVESGKDGNRGFLELLRRVDRDPRLLAAADWLRDRAPGDPKYGDPLSVGGTSATDLLGRRLASGPAEPSVFRELGMGALQVWQAHAARYPQETEGSELAVLFTDLAGFSDWTLQVGDETAVELLRRVGAEIEPLIRRSGTLVKRLGDGYMAVFDDPDEAVAVAVAARDAVDRIVVHGHNLPLRAGVHVGRPQQLSNDYFGRDVNIAARVAAAASGGEVLISSPTREKLTAPADLRRRSFTAKGVPEGIHVYTVSS